MIPDVSKNAEAEPIISKSFVLKHMFENVLSMKDGNELVSDKEEHFGALWNMYIKRNKEHLSFYTYCSMAADIVGWEIKVDTKTKLFSNCGNDEIREYVDIFKIEGNNKSSCWGWSKYLKWYEMEKQYLNGGNLEFEVTFKVKEMTGMYEEMRNFDESMKHLSDVILNVNDKKFYVSKLNLATHSPYFESLFLGRFEESNQAEIKLSGIDPDDFQKYLEILHFLNPINEYNVEGILLIADMYDTQIVVSKCEKYLMKKSKKTLKKKLDMAVRYNLNELKNKILSEIKTRGDIEKVLPNNLESMDHSIMADLFKKSLTMK